MLVVAEVCQLLAVAKSANEEEKMQQQQQQQFPSFAISCQKLPSDVKNCHQLPQVAIALWGS